MNGPAFGESAMPAKNVDHDAVIRALVADGWTITDDPLKLEYGDRNLYVDLGAESSAVGAEKSGRKIAVEIQSFLSASRMALRSPKQRPGNGL
jgi:hypothetical protein